MKRPRSISSIIFFFTSPDPDDNEIFWNILDDTYNMPPLFGIKITQNHPMQKLRSLVYVSKFKRHGSSTPQSIFKFQGFRGLLVDPKTFKNLEMTLDLYSLLLKNYTSKSSQSEIFLAVMHNRYKIPSTSWCLCFLLKDYGGASFSLVLILISIHPG